MTTELPVADRSTVGREAKALGQRHRRTLAVCAVLHLLAAGAALVPPQLLGHLVGRLGHGLTTSEVNTTTLLLAGSVLLSAGLNRWATFRSFVLGEEVLAELREDFIDGVLTLPLGTVERAGTGDLLTRTTADVDSLSKTVRLAVPQILVALLTVFALVVAMVLTAPLPTAAALVAGIPAALGTRWYLKRAPEAYLDERRAFTAVNARIAETAEAGRTVEAFGLQEQRIELAEADMRRCYATERRTLRLRCVFFPSCEVSYAIPPMVTLLVGGLLVLHGHAHLAQVTAVTLYAQQIADPIDTLLSWLDEMQVGITSFARLLGVKDVPADRELSGDVPDGEQVVADDVAFAYTAGRDVLEEIDLELQPGERLAVVGPSGAGKSTLGRLLAGVHPPGRGRVTVGGADLVGLAVEDLRREVSLVTQEHHVFAGTVADNLRLAVPDADDERLQAALDAVDWTGIPLDELVGPHGRVLSPAQSQQLALARLVLADPHTLVLDEATALLDPRAARHLERSLSAVLQGRTVVAIAHRLHTASDADRVAVVEDGRIVELGTHDELVTKGGSYAALWRSWHGQA